MQIIRKTRHFQFSNNFRMLRVGKIHGKQRVGIAVGHKIAGLSDKPRCINPLSFCKPGQLSGCFQLLIQHIHPVLPRLAARNGSEYLQIAVLLMDGKRVLNRPLDCLCCFCPDDAVPAQRKTCNPGTRLRACIFGIIEICRRAAGIQLRRAGDKKLGVQYLMPAAQINRRHQDSLCTALWQINAVCRYRLAIDRRNPGTQIFFLYRFLP